MTTVKDTFINALLADATYVGGLQSGMTGVALFGLSEMQTRMTPSLAKYLGDNFTVRTQIDSPDIVGTGFDATVWQGNAGTPYAGKVYVSTRGTEGLQDFLTDIDLAFSGNARYQLASMVNWWLRETTPMGQSVIQVDPVIGSPISNAGSSYTFFSPSATALGTGRLTDVSSVESVNGHPSSTVKFVSR